MNSGISDAYVGTCFLAMYMISIYGIAEASEVSFTSVMISFELAGSTLSTTCGRIIRIRLWAVLWKLKKWKTALFMKSGAINARCLSALKVRTYGVNMRG